MQRRDFLLSGAALGSLALSDATLASGQQPPAPADPGSTDGSAEPLVKGGVYQAGSRAQLFVDRMIVHRAEGVAFTPHPARKHPNNPLVVADRPWEGWRLRYGSVIYDEQERLFKLWYTGDSESDFPGDAALYATSQDGIHWQKPLIGTIAFGSFAAGTEAAIAAAAAGKPVAGKIAPGSHNAVAAGAGEPNVFKDDHDPDPARRYKMIAFVWDGHAYALGNPNHGYHSFVSPDGLNWTRHSKKAIAPAKTSLPPTTIGRENSGWPCSNSLATQSPRGGASFGGSPAPTLTPGASHNWSCMATPATMPAPWPGSPRLGRCWTLPTRPK